MLGSATPLDLASGILPLLLLTAGACSAVSALRQLISHRAAEAALRDQADAASEWSDDWRELAPRAPPSAQPRQAQAAAASVPLRRSAPAVNEDTASRPLSTAGAAVSVAAGAADAADARPIGARSAEPLLRAGSALPPLRGGSPDSAAGLPRDSSHSAAGAAAVADAAAAAASVTSIAPASTASGVEMSEKDEPASLAAMASLGRRHLQRRLFGAT